MIGAKSRDIAQRLESRELKASVKAVDLFPSIPSIDLYFFFDHGVWVLWFAIDCSYLQLPQRVFVSR